MAMSFYVRVYATGDIHGLLRALCRLVAACERDADGRPMRLVFIGDYIDRGPDSRSVVDYIMSLQSRLAANAICLMDNHEALALSAIDDLDTENWILNGGDMTLRSYDVSSALELPTALLRGFVRFGSPSTTVYDSLSTGINPARPTRSPMDQRAVSFHATGLPSVDCAWSYADQNWVAGTERKSSKYRYWCLLWWSLNGCRVYQRTEKSNLIYPSERAHHLGSMEESLEG